MADAFRCNTTDFSLCPAQNYSETEISGNANSIYDRPIAVLIGPNCCSMGDITAYLLDFHPMADFFGKSTCASMGYNEFITAFPGWILRYSFSDPFLVTDPKNHLNRREFPVDVPVWFNKDDIANGVDPVVKKAMEWIDSLSYTHDVSVQSAYLPGGETAQLVAQVENLNHHAVSIQGMIKEPGGAIVDSIEFYDDGNHNDGEAGDNIWGTSWTLPEGEEMYALDVTTEDTAAGTSRTLPNVVQFTSAGPVVIDGITYSGDDTIPNSGDKINFYITLRNNGLTAPAVNIKAELTSLDTLASVLSIGRSFANIAPGEQSTHKSAYKIAISEDCPANKEILVKADISSDDYTFWSDTFSILVRESVNIEDISEPMTRIYPNPTNAIINIEINNTDEQGVEIELFTVTGKVIYQKEYKNIPAHFVKQIDLSGYTKGLYFVKVKQANAIYMGKIIVW
jgi:hypothetical protein